jgi:hypothetical protein
MTDWLKDPCLVRMLWKKGREITLHSFTQKDNSGGVHSKKLEMVISISGLLIAEHLWQMYVLKVWEPCEYRYSCSMGSCSKSDYLDSELVKRVITPQIVPQYSCSSSADKPWERPSTVFRIYDDFMGSTQEVFGNAALSVPYH